MEKVAQDRGAVTVTWGGESVPGHGVKMIEGLPPGMRLVRDDGSEVKAGDIIGPEERIALRDASITGPLAPESTPSIERDNGPRLSEEARARILSACETQIVSTIAGILWDAREHSVPWSTAIVAPGDAYFVARWKAATRAAIDGDEATSTGDRLVYDNLNMAVLARRIYAIMRARQGDEASATLPEPVPDAPESRLTEEEIATLAPTPTPEDIAAAKLRLLVHRFEAIDPEAIGKPDRLTLAVAPRMLARIAGKLGSFDPGIVAQGVLDVRRVAQAWSDPTSPAAKLWGEAVAAVKDLAPGVEAKPSPAAELQAIFQQAYGRGKREGAEEERAKTGAWRAWGKAVFRKLPQTDSADIELVFAWSEVRRLDPEGAKS